MAHPFAGMASDPESRAADYREFGYRLWRISLDQRRDIDFELRRELTIMADEFEDLAGRVEEERALAD